MTPEKTREIRVRRMLTRWGYTLSKSRRRDPRALDYGTFTISYQDGSAVYEASDLDEVEQWAFEYDRAPAVNETWERIGEVGIDTGRLLLTDPAYLELMTEAFLASPQGDDQHATWRNRNGLGIAEIVTDFGGDGLYPVRVMRAANGQIAAVRVDFTYDEDIQP